MLYSNYSLTRFVVGAGSWAFALVATLSQITISPRPASLPAPVKSAAAERTSEFAFVNVSVVDAVEERILPQQVVVVRNGRIASVSDTAQARIPEGAVRIDGKGKFLIPGLWDMHTHWYAEEYLPLFIANGVIGIRMMAGFPLHHAWRDAIAKGTLVGPRLVIASKVVDGPAPVWPGSAAVGTAEEGREAVREAKKAGADFVKVYSLLPRDAYFAIADEAKKLGIPFDGHIPDSVSAAETARAGQRCIEHLTGVLLACSSRADELTRRWREVYDTVRKRKEGSPWRAANAAIRDDLLTTYDSATANELFALFREQQTWHCPTLTVNRSMSHLNLPEFTDDKRLQFIPAQIRESWNPANDFRLKKISDADFEAGRRVYARELALVGAMHRAGVPLIAGTDVLNPYCFPGFSLHDELELFVQAGLSPAAALRTATINSARFLEREDSSGTIAEGKVADLVVLEANPLENIAHTRRITGVMAAGRWFDQASIASMLERCKTLANRKSIVGELASIIEQENVQAAIERYHALKNSEADAYDFSEQQLNFLGYQLLENDQVDAAVEIFKLNVAMFPEAWNPYDSLGEAYLKQGRKELAIRNYRKSLELNPENESALQALEKLEDTAR